MMTKNKNIPKKYLKALSNILVSFCKTNTLVYTSLLLIITLRFKCDKRKIWSTIKKSQNIMNMIAARFQQEIF